MEVLVKVGKKTSELRFSNSECHRAVTTYELKRNVEEYTKCNTLIVEGVYAEEERELREFLSVWHRDKSHKTIFICDANTLESKVASESNCDTVSDLKSLYSKLRELGFEVSTLIDDITANKDRTQQAVYSNPEEINNSSASSKIDSAMEEIEKADTESDKQLNERFESIDAEMAKSEAEVESDKLKDFVSAELSEQKIKYIKLEGKWKKAELDLEAAKQKIAKLTSLVDTAREENAKLSVSIEKMSLASELTEETVSKSDFDSVKEALDETERRVVSLKSQLDTVKDFNGSLKEQLKTKEAELNESIKTADKYRKQYAELNSKVSLGEASEEVDDLKAQIRRQEKTIQSKVEEVSILSDKVASLEEQISDLYDRITSESDALAKKNVVLVAVLEKMNSVIKANKSSEVKIDRLQRSLEDYKKQLEEKNKLLDTNSTEYAKAKASADQLETKVKNAVADKERELERLRAELGTLKTKIESLKKVDEDTISSLRKELSDSKEQLNAQAKQMTESSINYAKMKEQVDAADTRIQIAIADEKRAREYAERQLKQCEAKLSATERQLDTKTIQYDNLISSIGMDAGGVQALVAENKAFQNTNATLSSKLSASSKENESLERTVKNLRDKLKESDESNRQLQASLRNLSGLGGGDSSQAASMVKTIKYSSPGRIIPIVGCGSYGVTTVAYSLAYKLGSTESIVVADFDVISPSLDAWFNRSPMSSDIARLVGDGRKASALGLFIEKGTEAFSKLSDRVISNIERVKGGSISYLGGLYYKADPIKVGAADYEGLLSFLGSKYENVIIDFGNLGISDLQDQLIKVVSNISPKLVIVTPNDKFKVRDMRMKLDALGIDTSRVSWLLNMSRTTSIDDTTRKYIGKAKLSIMPFEPDFFGLKDKFSRNKLTRDKFELFVNQNLFGK